MKLSFSGKGKILLFISTLILVLFVACAQLLYLTPLKSDLNLKQQSLKSEQKLLDQLSQKKASEETKGLAEDTRELQKRIPVKPLQEQLILDLEKAETLSNSKVSSMGFALDGAVTSDPNAQQNQPNNSNGSTASATTTENGTMAQPAVAAPLLKKLAVQLSVESPTYKDLEKFISTLEALQRVVVVENISYSGTQEITTLAQEDQPLTYSLTISAFYMPELTDLADHLPKIDAPAPAGKDNPLTQFPTVVQNQP